MTTPAEVRAKVQETVTEIIGDYKDEPETDRETLIERMDEDCDTLFGQLVKQGRIDQYSVDAWWRPQRIAPSSSKRPILGNFTKRQLIYRLGQARETRKRQPTARGQRLRVHGARKEMKVPRR